MTQAISPSTRKWSGHIIGMNPTVPPQVTYGLTERGLELCGVLDQLNGGVAESKYELPSSPTLLRTTFGLLPKEKGARSLVPSPFERGLG
ncbi:MAG: winged helix-turn-helix transcriptional regulator [Leptolyngbyaceae cyanobacterium CAN_BIN12]|nr:winged helix-turn-helix transcriptional regulator [Leptolyngbyaceae cyanobacterium CAN_BIN12]